MPDHHAQAVHGRRRNVFFALWPPREAAEALHAWAIQAHRVTRGRVTRLESIHLTLAFLGELPTERIDAAIAAARDVCAAPHEMVLDAARWWKHNRIVWAGPQDAPADTRSIADQLRRALVKEGFALEEREFVAHVTLIRKAGAGALPPLPRIAWPVQRFVLARSGAAGQGYEMLEIFPLG